MPHGTFDRATNLNRLAAEEFDVVIVGAGITGAGAALDAASRGLRTALIERDDLASGTSSKSSKLVHGGLRYLQQKEFGLVYEALHERQRLRRNAPHLVRILPFLIPLFGKSGTVNKAYAKAISSALWLYDLTGGWRIGRLHQRISVEDALGHVPTLRADRLVAAFLYYDATADDARLTLALARTAALEHGAVVVNHASVTGLGHDPAGRVRSVSVTTADGDVEVTTKTVVNATGVWADEIRTLDEGHDPDSIRPAKGVHITVPWDKVRNDIAAVVPVPGDKRSVFVVRWGDRTYVGTTDTDDEGGIDEPICTAADVDYLLGALNASLAEPLDRSDVIGTWAGHRPLVKAATSGRTADMSRKHTVSTSPGGVVTVTGGKLTTYRKMADDAVDEVVRLLGASPRGRLRGRTKRLPLRGALGFEEAAARAGLDADDLRTGDGHGGADDSVAAHLVRRYGSEAAVVEALIARQPDLGRPLVAGLPYVRAEAVHAVTDEMAVDLADVLDRRTRCRLLDSDATAAAADDVADLIGAHLGWDVERCRREAAAYRRSIAEEATGAGLGPEVELGT